MLTYSPDTDRTAPATTAERPWLLLLLCLVWLLPGLVGHDPWKPRELETAAVIGRFLAGQHWSIPWFADAPYLIDSPLYYWFAALVAWPASKLGMSIHDAARMTTGVWAALALWGTGLAGRELFGRRHGRMSVILLIGCIGLIIWGHQLSAKILLLTGFAWQAYALALARRQPLSAGLALAFSWLVLLLGSSLAEFLLAVVAAGVVGLYAPWRRAGYLVTLVTGLVLALPIGAIWLADFYQANPALFRVWMDQYAFGPFGGVARFGFFHAFGYFLAVAPWFTWPVLPLAVWGAWALRRDLRAPAFLLPATLLALHTLWLISAAEGDESYLLIVLPPLALLATPGIESLRRGAAAALNWFGVLTLGLMAGLLWLGWLVLHLNVPLSWASELQKQSPAYRVDWHAAGMLFALLLTAVWIWVLSRKRPLGRRAVTNWACGVTLLWGVLIGLWQPWLDAQKSYRSVSESLARDMKQRTGCIGGLGVSDSIAASLDYFVGIAVNRVDPESCPWLLTQDQLPAGGVAVWHDNRPGERREQFYLSPNPELDGADEAGQSENQ
ncbi:ArnT family glycosyltransferase [Andreprevotia chitinilytica]|uniref:ArnT family glycosyltransferase n=1 Tax=Andreprevotia chitinilytica TaxID=396808 RepID=UPI00068CF162|nr:hypothetical protein [Andreprevotia chitinilytica]